MRFGNKLVATTAIAALGAAGLVALPVNVDDAAAAPSTSLVISEVYGGGGNSGASYKRDFIELYNVSDQPIDLSGWQVEYFSAKTGNSGGTTSLSGTVAPGDYYLIAQSRGSGGTVDFEFDAEGSLNMGGREGIVELSNNGTTVDLVGWGAAKRFEGTPAASTSNSTSAARTPVTQDTDNNKADFTIGEPTPQKSGGAASEPTETPQPTEAPEPTETPQPTEPGSAATPIVEVQGEGDKSPLVDQTVTVEGIVTAVYPTGGKNGFFIQAPGEADPTRSSGVFIYGSNYASDVQIGDSVSVTGKVGENFGATQITATGVSKLEQSLGEATPVKLDAWPATDAERERYEGMLLELSGNYTVTDNYGLNSYGEIGLAFGTKPLVQPTEVAAPDSAEAHEQAAYNAAHGVLLDDGSTWNYTKSKEAQNSPLPYLSLDKPVTVGATATFTKPVVLDYGHNAWRLQPQQQVVGADSEWIPAAFSDAREAAPAEVGGDITVGTFNVLNYFTSLGEQESGCKFYTDREGNPTTNNYCHARGAYNGESFERQQTKIVSAINKLDASVIALEEIEDSADFGQNRDAALANLVNELNKSAGAEKWAYVPSPATIPATGDDVIRTAFIYQPAEVSYVDGSTEILDNPNFTNARAPLAATFTPVAKADQKFVMIANHLKSKGGEGSGDNASFDKDDNPANNVGGWNGDRTRQAQAVVDFAAAQQQKQGTDLVFLTGDFNAYTMEDPVQTIINAGYVQQVSEGEYSYLFGGMVGSLDHVFASPAAAKLVTGADIWTINAYEPIALEYSRNNSNVTQLYAPDQYRASDHNPMLIGLQFTQVPEPTETSRPTEAPEPTQTPEPTETPGPTQTQQPTATPIPGEVTLSTDASEYLLRSTVTFRGEGFTPGAEVTIELHSNPVKVADVVADENGAIEGKFTVPATTAPGAHRVVAVESADKTASAEITVLEPQLEVTPVKASAADSTDGFYVEGAHWPANTELSFVVTGPNGYRAELTDVITNDDGAFAQQLTWAEFDAEGNLIADNLEFPAGTYTVTVTDGEFTQKITFTVTGSDASLPEKADTQSGAAGVNSADVTDKLATTGASNMTPLLVATLLVLAAGASMVALRRRNAERNAE